MTIEEIRESAPKGATHIDKSGDYWIVKSDDESYFQDGGNGEWFRYAFPVNVDIENGYIKPL